MTFEGWFKDNFLFGKLEDYKLTELESIIKENCRQAWNAAKEDSKPEVIYYVEFSSLVGDWLIVDCDRACIEDGFPTELDAREWAIENGYRIADSL